MPRPFQISFLFFFCWSFFLTDFVSTQTNSETSPVVTFTMDFPESHPEHYSIRVSSSGSARYESNGRISADSDVTDNFGLDFTITPETRQRIFELAAKAGYFQKDLDSHHKSLAFTGTKTLAYADGKRTGTSTFNYSPNTSVQDLTALMQNLSATLEFGHRLEYDRRYQKLALDEELKKMEDLVRSRELIEVTAIQPILDQIVADQTVINISRARAQRLLERSGAH